MEEDDTSCYKFSEDRKYQGLAIIICNFTKGKHKRNGSEVDIKNMKKTFKRLGFKVRLYKDLTKDDTTNLLESMQKSDELKTIDSFAFAISTHGVEVERAVKRNVEVNGHNVVEERMERHHCVVTFDDKNFETRKILQYFSDKNCKALRRKPKMFFIQACRIPSSQGSQDQFDAGIGFDPGQLTARSSPEKLKPKRGDITDSRDADVFDRMNLDDDYYDEEDFDDEAPLDEVSDTDISDDEARGDNDSVMKDHDTKTMVAGAEQDGYLNLEKRQDAIFNKLTQLKGEVGILQSKYSSHVSAGETKGGGDMDTVDPAKGIRLHPSSDTVDPPKGKRIYPRPAVRPPKINITVVPCYNDMLVMFSSPQGYYAHRNREKGSYFLRDLYDTIRSVYEPMRDRTEPSKTTVNDVSFLRVLHIVSNKMSKSTYRTTHVTNVPCLLHCLTKDIKFARGDEMVKSKWFCL